MMIILKRAESGGGEDGHPLGPVHARAYQREEMAMFRALTQVARGRSQAIGSVRSMSKVADNM